MPVALVATIVFHVLVQVRSLRARRVPHAHAATLRRCRENQMVDACILARVRPLDGPHEPERPACWRCGRATYDPDKRSVPWARAVAGGRQVLICPFCQAEPGWADGLDRCGSCGATRLSIQLGEIVCRACGHTAQAGA